MRSSDSDERSSSDSRTRRLSAVSPSRHADPRGSVSVPLITPRYQKKSRFFKTMNVTDSAPRVQRPGMALSQQNTEDMTIQNGPIRYSETVHFQTYDLFRHGKSQIHSRSVGYSSDGDLVIMREDLSEVSDVDAITKRQTIIYDSTVLNPRAQAPLTDSELHSSYYRRFKKKYPGIRAPRNKKIRNRLMNDFFASEEAIRLRDMAREFRDNEEEDVSAKPFFSALPPELASSFVQNAELQGSQKYWSPQQKPVAPLDPESSEARLQLLNTRLRAELQRAFNSAFLTRQIEDLEATFTLYIQRGDPDESLVIHFRDGYGRLVCHGVAAYYSLLSNTVTAGDGTKLTYVNFPKGKKGTPHLVPLPMVPLLTVLGPCALPRHALSTNSTPNVSPALMPVPPPPDGPMSPLDLGANCFVPHTGAEDSLPPAPCANSTVLILNRSEVLHEDVPVYEPQLYVVLPQQEEGSPQIVAQPPTALTQTQRKKLRKAERAQYLESGLSA